MYLNHRYHSLILGIYARKEESGSQQTRSLFGLARIHFGNHRDIAKCIASTRRHGREKELLLLLDGGDHRPVQVVHRDHGELHRLDGLRQVCSVEQLRLRLVSVHPLVMLPHLRVADEGLATALLRTADGHPLVVNGVDVGHEA